MAQVVERYLGVVEAVGSSPATQTSRKLRRMPKLFSCPFEPIERSLIMLKKLIGTKNFYRKVMMLVIPIILQNGITNLVSMVDNIMVGTIGTEQMSAVAIVNQLMFVFNLAIFGMVSGVGIFTAQYFGKGDTDGIRQTVRLKLVTSIIILVLSIIIFIFFGSFLINSYLHEGTEPMDLELAFEQAKIYLEIMLVGLIPFVITQVYGSTFREVERPVIPMVASIIAVVVNLVFNYFLIFGTFGFRGSVLQVRQLQRLFQDLLNV